MTPLGRGQFGPQGHSWQDLWRGLLNVATQNIKALGLMVSEKKIFYVFPIITLWELSVAMETRVPIQFSPKHNAAFPPP